MRIVAYDVQKTAEPVDVYRVQYLTLEKLLADADIVTLHIPSNPATHGLIGGDQPRIMKPTAIPVNTARPDVLDYDALTQEIKEKRPAGAALDVWPDEPVSAHELFSFSNVVASPHVGGSSGQSSSNARMRGAENMLSGLRGSPRDVVNSHALTTSRIVPSGMSAAVD